jgi:hypothetical protein
VAIRLSKTHSILPPHFACGKQNDQ